MDKNIFAKLTVEVEVPQQMIEDLLATAFEGGSNYWIASAERLGERYGKFLHEQAFSGGIQITVSEDYDKPVAVLNRQTMAQGLQLMANKHSRHFKDMMNDNADADTADVYLQCCVLGDVIFG